MAYIRTILCKHRQNFILCHPQNSNDSPQNSNDIQSLDQLRVRILTKCAWVWIHLIASNPRNKCVWPAHQNHCMTQPVVSSLPVIPVGKIKVERWVEKKLQFENYQQTKIIIRKHGFFLFSSICFIQHKQDVTILHSLLFWIALIGK